MTSYDNYTQGDCLAIARITLRCMRAYRSLLHGGLYEDSMLSALSTSEIAVLREMMLEVYDDYDVMNVGNAILFLDDEVKRREAVAAVTLTVTTRYPDAPC